MEQWKFPTSNAWDSRSSKDGQHSQSFTRYDAKIAAPNNYNTECRVLIENGDLDQEVPKDTIVEPWAFWILQDSCGVMVTSSLFNGTLLELCMINS